MYLYLYGGEHPSEFSERLVRKALADYAVRQQLGVPDEILENTVIAKEEKGKPYFEGLELPERDKRPAAPGGDGRPAVHFSVSHSGSFWGCLMADEPVGFDMEVCRETVKYKKIAERYFTDEECNLVVSKGTGAFFEVWVRKEAYVKYLGSGLAAGLDSFSTVEGGKLMDRVVPGDPERAVLWASSAVSADMACTDFTDKSGQSAADGTSPCFVKPCDIADGVKAAYCSASGNPLTAVIWLESI